jgi:hypothetical protein
MKTETVLIELNHQVKKFNQWKYLRLKCAQNIAILASYEVDQTISFKMCHCSVLGRIIQTKPVV